MSWPSCHLPACPSDFCYVLGTVFMMDKNMLYFVILGLTVLYNANCVEQ